MPGSGGEALGRREPTAANTETERAGRRRSADEVGPVDYGGDAACWLSHVCTECGALVEGSTATPCWRCGTVHDPTT